MGTIHLTQYCLAAIACWLIVGAAAGYAVFSRRINDTLLERVGLSGISICSAGIVVYLWRFGWISAPGFCLSLSLGLYVIAVVHKHWLRYSRGEPPEQA